MHPKDYASLLIKTYARKHPTTLAQRKRALEVVARLVERFGRVEIDLKYLFE